MFIVLKVKDFTKVYAKQQCPDPSLPIASVPLLEANF